MSLTIVTDTDSKAHAHLNFACMQAKCCISLERWGVEIVLVEQTSHASYPSSTIKLELLSLSHHPAVKLEFLLRLL